MPGRFSAIAVLLPIVGVLPLTALVAVFVINRDGRAEIRGAVSRRRLRLFRLSFFESEEELVEEPQAQIGAGLIDPLLGLDGNIPENVSKCSHFLSGIAAHTSLIGMMTAVF